MAANPRYANGHRRRELRKRVLASKDVCGICGGLVDKTLPHLDPMAPEVDEVVPVSMGGDPLARANVRLAHRRHLQPTARQRHAHPEADRTRLDDLAAVVTSHPHPGDPLPPGHSAPSGIAPKSLRGPTTWPLALTCTNAQAADPSARTRGNAFDPLTCTDRRMR